MGLFNRFKKNNVSPPQEINSKIEQIFEKLSRNQEASKRVDKAISYRELGEYGESIKILKEVIKKYPEYFPAKTVLGVTMIHKRDFSGAEMLFLDMIKEYKDTGKYPLTEAYANLGSIRWRHLNDIEGAINYYKFGNTLVL